MSSQAFPSLARSGARFAMSFAPAPQSPSRPACSPAQRSWHDVAAEDVARELAASRKRLEAVLRQIESLERLEAQMRAWQRMRG